MAYQKKYVSQKSAFAFNPESFPWLPIAIFIAVIYFYGMKLLEKLRILLNPDNYNNDVIKPIEAKNKSALASKVINNDGVFLNGLGQVPKDRQTVTMAKQASEELSAILQTGKKDTWYSKIFAWGWTGDIDRIEAICTPNSPASYRRYVIEVYRDIYTDKRSLQSDIRGLY